MFARLGLVPVIQTRCVLGNPVSLGQQAAGTFRSFSTSTPYLAQASSYLLNLQSLESAADHTAARAWLNGLTVEDIPKQAYEIGLSRSSGPGGQHVNKTNSKATIRCDLVKSSSTWLPPFMLSPLSKSPYYLPSPPSLLISSQNTRSASSNTAEALRNLHANIVNAGLSILVGETTEGQKNRVKGLIAADKGRTRADKARRSQRKAARREF